MAGVGGGGGIREDHDHLASQRLILIQWERAFPDSQTKVSLEALGGSRTSIPTWCWRRLRVRPNLPPKNDAWKTNKEVALLPLHQVGISRVLLGSRKTQLRPAARKVGEKSLPPPCQQARRGTWTSSAPWSQALGPHFSHCLGVRGGLLKQKI